MDVKVTIENQFASALRAFAASRGGAYGMDKAINKAMQFLVSFAVRKIPAADRAVIRATYMARVRPALRTARPQNRQRREKAAAKALGKPVPPVKPTRGKGAARRRQLVYSFAALKVFRTNYKGARDLTGDAFYALVGKYVASRQFSSGYHKSGLIPALNTFRRMAGLQERMPRYKNLPGRAKAAKATEIIPEAEVADAARAIATIAPNAFSDSAPEVVRLLNQFAAENLNQRLKGAGLK